MRWIHCSFNIWFKWIFSKILRPVRQERSGAGAGRYVLIYNVHSFSVVYLVLALYPCEGGAGRWYVNILKSVEVLSPVINAIKSIVNLPDNFHRIVYYLGVCITWFWSRVYVISNFYSSYSNDKAHRYAPSISLPQLSGAVLCSRQRLVITQCHWNIINFVMVAV